MTVGRLGPRMRQVVGTGDFPTARGNCGVDVGRPTATNGEFVAHLCESASTDQAGVCGSSGFGPGIRVWTKGNSYLLSTLGHLK